MSNGPSSSRVLNSDRRKCLFLASEVRCGSTYVAEAVSYELNDAFGFELWDLTKEHFSDINDDTTADQVLTTWGSLFYDRSGFIASKFMCKSLSYLHRLASLSPAVREAFFGEHAYWIVVRRQDRLEQAVSLALALKSKTFHHYDDPDLANDRNVDLTLEEMDWALKAVAISDVYLQAFSTSIAAERVVSLFYKDFLKNEIEYINDIHRLCNFPERDPRLYVNKSKLRPTGQEVKRLARERFKEWFLANHA